MFSKLSLKSLLCIHSVFCILITAIIVISVTSLLLRTLAEQKILESNIAYARKLADSVDNLFRTGQEDLSFTANQIQSFNDLKSLNNEAERLMLQSNMFASILVLSTEGRVITSSPSNFISPGTSLNLTLEQLKNLKKGPFVSEPLTSYAGNYLVFLSTPLHSLAGENLGYIAGSIYLRKESMLSNLLKHHFFADRTVVSIVSDNGEVVYSSDEMLTGKKIILSAKLSAKLKLQKFGSMLTTLNQQECLLGYSDVVKANWHVFVCVSPDVTTTIINDIFTHVILYGLLVAILLIIASIYISFKISQPLEKLASLTGSGTTEQLTEHLTEKIQEVKTCYKEAEKLKKAFLTYSITINSTFSSLRDDALMDHLTKLHNRRGFEQLTASFLSNKGLHCLCSFDIDHFKKVNDQYGHDIGDQVLIAVSGILKKWCRTQDIICRFGGEEFVVFFPDTLLPQAKSVADRIRINIANINFPVVGHITISAGVCSLEPYGYDLEKALASADLLLYRAKHKGRNRVISSKEKD